MKPYALSEDVYCPLEYLNGIYIDSRGERVRLKFYTDIGTFILEYSHDDLNVARELAKKIWQDWLEHWEVLESRFDEPEDRE